MTSKTMSSLSSASHDTQKNKLAYLEGRSLFSRHCIILILGNKYSTTHFTINKRFSIIEHDLVVGRIVQCTAVYPLHIMISYTLI